mmetsp:Transcript_88875/g.212161  ORF Transcript_88875/g.212161 Transcript_88875/m.212161 type:complete len:219 (-) Transcript_88875:3-659(-)
MVRTPHSRDIQVNKEAQLQGVVARNPHHDIVEEALNGADCRDHYPVGEPELHTRGLVVDILAVALLEVRELLHRFERLEGRQRHPEDGAHQLPSHTVEQEDQAQQQKAHRHHHRGDLQPPRQVPHQRHLVQVCIHRLGCLPLEEAGSPGLVVTRGLHGLHVGSEACRKLAWRRRWQWQALSRLVIRISLRLDAHGHRLRVAFGQLHVCNHSRGSQAEI